jgi:DNA-binding transcriptional regulator YiaG
MSINGQGASRTLAEYVLDDLGTSFQVKLHNSVERRNGPKGLEIFIPDYHGLMKQIAISRVLHSAKLKAGDIKFLRKTLGVKSKELASKLDVTPEHMSRCEAGHKVLSPNSERVLRLIILQEAIYVARKALEDARPKAHSETIDSLIDKLTDLIDKNKSMMDGLEIRPIQSAGEEIVFEFTLVNSIKREIANDTEVDVPLEWSHAA